MPRIGESLTSRSESYSGRLAGLYGYMWVGSSPGTSGPWASPPSVYLTHPGVFRPGKLHLVISGQGCSSLVLSLAFEGQPSREPLLPRAVAGPPVGKSLICLALFRSVLCVPTSEESTKFLACEEIAVELQWTPRSLTKLLKSCPESLPGRRCKGFSTQSPLLFKKLALFCFFLLFFLETVFRTSVFVVGQLSTH